MLDNTPNTIPTSASTAAQAAATDSAQTIRDEQSFEIALTAARAADDRKGGDIVCLDVGGVSVIADYFLVITGYSTTQVKAIVTAIEDALLENLELQPLRVEGKHEGTWVLLDYGDAIIHVQLEAEREFYNLEAFWGHSTKISLELG